MFVHKNTQFVHFQHKFSLHKVFICSLIKHSNTNHLKSQLKSMFEFTQHINHTAYGVVQSMYTQLHLQLYQSAYKVLGIVVCNKIHLIIRKYNTKKMNSISKMFNLLLLYFTTLQVCEESYLQGKKDILKGTMQNSILYEFKQIFGSLLLPEAV